MRGPNESLWRSLAILRRLDYSSRKGEGSGSNNPRVLGTEFLFTSQHRQNYFCSCKSFQGHVEDLEPGAGGTAGRRREIINRPNGPTFLETNSAYEEGDVQKR